MISFDGDRSKKRRWFANSKMRLLKLFGISSKAFEWEGFRFTLWQQDDISGGRIIAPAGLIVAASNTTNVKLAMAENWKGAITSLSTLNGLGYSPIGEAPALRLLEFPEGEALTAAGYDVFEYIPYNTETEFGQGDTYTSPKYSILNTETSYTDLSCRIGLHPFESAEAVWMTLVDRADYPDKNPNSGYEYYKCWHEQVLLFYISDNSNLTGKLGFLAHEDSHWLIQNSFAYHPAIPRLFSIPQRINSKKVNIIRNSTSYTSYYPGIDILVAWSLVNPAEGVTPLTIEDITLDSLLTFDDSTIPSMLAVLYSQRYSTADAFFTCSPAGTYCFQLNGIDYIFHAVCAEAANSEGSPGDPGHEMGVYFKDNPSHSKWCAFYVFKVGETSYLIDSSNFLSILDSHSSYDLVSDTTQVGPDYEFESEPWRQVAEVLRYILMVPPVNYNHIFPYDSYMFHTGDGDIIAWSRRLGAFKFTTTGVEVAFTFNLPTEVTSTDGVQPQISYSGTYDETHMYLCICEKISEEVKAVYFGSPFIEWFALPMPAEGPLLYVRPIKVSPSIVQLIGVVKVPAEVEDEFEYRAVSLNYTGTETWTLLTKLPFTVEDKTVFSMCLFGNEQAVKDMAEYSTPVNARPQIPVGPYNLYNSVL